MLLAENIAWQDAVLNCYYM